MVKKVGPTYGSKMWIIYAVFTLCLWSTLAYLTTLLTAIPPFLLLGITLLIGSLPSLKHAREWFQDFTVLALGVAGIFGYHFFFFIALRKAPPVEANLLNYLWPILIVLLSPLFFKEYRLKWNHLAGGVIAFLGAVLCISSNGFHFESQNVLGYLCAIAAALTWALYSVATKKKQPFPTSAVGGFCFVSGLLALFIHGISEPSVSITPANWGAIVAMGIGPLGIAFYTWDRAMKEGDPRVVGSLAYAEPLLSSLVLITLGHKYVTFSFYISIFLIVAGAILSSFRLSEI